MQMLNPSFPTTLLNYMHSTSVYAAATFVSTTVRYEHVVIQSDVVVGCRLQCLTQRTPKTIVQPHRNSCKET